MLESGESQNIGMGGRVVNLSNFPLGSYRCCFLILETVQCRSIVAKMDSTFCDLCDKSFSNKYNLNHHNNRVHTRTQDINCNLCNNSFSNQYHLDDHKRRVHTKIRFKCDLCDKSYKSQKAVRDHKLIIHEKLRAFKCNLCSKTYTDNTPLRVHNEVAHGKEGFYPCTECGKAFPFNVKLREHYSKAHGGGQLNKEKVKCKICSDEIAKYALKSHLRGHANLDKKIFKCETCLNVYPTAGRLKSHMDVHKSAKVLQCTKCEKMYKSRKYLLQHMRFKHGKAEKMYKCNICGNNYVQPGSLYVHQRKHIGGEFECATCGTIYDTVFKLRKHLSRHKGKYKECDICHKQFMGSMTMHLRTHSGEKPFKCTYCQQQFSIGGNLRNHIKRVHLLSKINECEQCIICTKNIYVRHMESHMLFHSGSRPYQCNECGKSFTIRDRLTIHRKNIHKKESDFIKTCLICFKKITCRKMEYHMTTQHLEY